MLRDLDAGCAVVIELERLSDLAAALDKARAQRGRRPGPARLAQALRDVAAVAGALRSGLQRLGVDLALLDEAITLARALTSAPASSAAADRRALGELRDRLLVLADERVRRISAIASFVFRDHPELRRAGRRSSLRR